MPWKQALQPNILTFLYSNISDLKGRDDEGGRGYENDEKGQDGIAACCRGGPRLFQEVPQHYSGNR